MSRQLSWRKNVGPRLFRRSSRVNSAPSLSASTTPAPGSPEQSLRAVPAIKEELWQILLTNIDQELDKRKNGDVTTSLSPNFSHAMRDNMEVFSSILAKVGGASSTAYQTNFQGDSHKVSGACLHALSELLKGVGNLHWMGAVFAVLGFGIERCNQVKDNKAECWDILGELRDLARRLLDLVDILEEGYMEEVFALICRHVVECVWMASESKTNSAFFAPANGKRLSSLREEITHLYRDLTLLGVTACQTTFCQSIVEDDEMVGMPARVDDILREMEKDPGQEEVRAIVLCGMPGIGKSAQGHAVCARLLETTFKRENACKISMNQVSTKHERDVMKKQSEIIEKLSKKNVRFSDFKSGQEGLREYFNRRTEPVLIFIDDVENEKQVEKLLPRKLDNLLPPRSRLVVTTFNERVFDVIKEGVSCCRLYEVKELNRNEAEKLFCMRAFGDPQIPPDLKEEVEDLLCFCVGHPLALQEVGNVVRKRESKKKALKHALGCLRNGDPICGLKDDSIISTLKKAYDELASSPQSAFLDISANFVGRRWKEVELRYGEEDLLTLKQLSLVKKENHGLKTVEMHPLLAALGSGWDRLEHGGARIVSKVEEDVHIFDDPERARNVELLHLDHCEPAFPADKLSLCSKLRHLELYGIRIEGQCEKAPRNLKTFRFDCLASGLPFPLTQLRALIDMEIHSNSQVDKHLDTFKPPPQLKRLVLTNSETLEEIDKGGKSLEQVIIRHCPRLRKVGPLSSSQHMVSLEIRGCQEITDLHSLRKLGCLQRLSLIDCGLKGNFRVPQNVLFLDVSSNPDLERLPDLGHSNPKVSYRNCPRLKEVPKGLQVPLLNIDHCGNLRDLLDGQMGDGQMVFDSKPALQRCSPDGVEEQEFSPAPPSKCCLNVSVGRKGRFKKLFSDSGFLQRSKCFHLRPLHRLHFRRALSLQNCGCSLR